MKKLLTITAVTLALCGTVAAAPAFADDHGGSSKDRGGMFEKNDTNGDGAISKAEFLSHAEEKFADMDADGNGEISKDEAKAKREAMKDKWKEKRQERVEKRQNKDGVGDE